MIIVTGGAGFIGANIVAALNHLGRTRILIVDNLEKSDKFLNLRDLRFFDYQDKREFREALRQGRWQNIPITAILHQGACSDTMEYDGRYMMDNNYQYSKELFHFAVARKIPFVYASSAATYGDSSRFAEHPDNENPLNIYGYSKLLFDRYVAQNMEGVESTVAGLRYFNVYGPREGHKGRMASMVHQLHEQIRRTGRARLFAGSGGYGNGEQRRDFIHVADVAAINLALAEQSEPVRGVFNVGTGVSRSFNDIVASLYQAMNKTPEPIEYVPMPEGLAAKYQNFTEADISKLLAIRGLEVRPASLEQGVAAFVRAKEAGL
ncbi:MAG: ADP-glyceromanno-heptose 6-epimerase [Magnetococcales bacterium]|nr:ADP-glyceromanno-heptose 6-epimerase [Magnetococcales bacterium]MBF0149845.1 ADP-glyceromanno-heptose 6-epimerase [Magnetococcales bacterium]MBF0173661.1 ADP-glyceromanno-heptose 6-epimerase [Magnetococcales bacterium]MBF0346583.1 ADP-glyceromanno-heptose 6-epimerase [Magnetococcales bacterium]MBF0631141.1 ADP-glyceromanno-heptose 6-epimerase [Magnetococcales bacterium]